MKKVWILLLSLFAILGVISCNGDTTIPTTENYLSEQLAMPSNLTINESTKVLTWGAVEHAAQYNVYVNGELKGEVKTTSFDFSKVTGAKLIFTVKAVAPKGMVNSQVSASLAFIANRADEVNKLKLKMTEYQMSVSNQEAFATELVNKGMLAEDLETMMTQIEFIETIYDIEEMSEIYTKFDDLFKNMDMITIEALVSALIKVEMKAMLQAEIDEYDTASPAEKDMYYDSEQIEISRQMLEFINTNGDQAVKSVMIIIDYMMAIEKGITLELVNKIEGLVNAQEMSDANITILISVKNDLINNFKTNLPELDEVILLNNTMLLLTQILTDDAVDTSSVNIPKQSAQALLSLELFFNFFLAMDKNYVSALLDATMAMEDPSGAKPFVKENIKLLNTFLKNNKTLIDQMDAVYTDAEKEALFFDFYMETIIQSYVSMVSLVPADDYSALEAIVKDNLDFSNILLLQDAMGDTFTDILDAIVKSDYAIIDKLFDLVSIDMDDYFNDETYESDWDAYYLAQEEATFALVKEILLLINPIIQSKPIEEYQATLDLIFSGLTIGLELSIETASAEEVGQLQEMLDILVFVKTGVNNTAVAQFNLMKSIMNIITTEDYLNDLQLLQSDTETDWELVEYGQAILMANAFDKFYTANKTNIDEIIAEIIATISEPDMMVTLNLKSADIVEIEEMIESMISDLSTNASVIKDYNYKTLTAGQIENVQAFMDILMGGAPSGQPV